MLYYWRKQGQCFRRCPFLLWYNTDKQVNTNNKHKSFTVLVRFFCLNVGNSRHRASRERQSEHVFAITPNTEGSPRNSHREAYNGCIIVQKYPLNSYRAMYHSDITTPPFFARDFPFLNFLERPITSLKARVWHFNTR